MVENELKERLDEFNCAHDPKNEFDAFKKNLVDSDVVVTLPSAFFFIGEHSVMHGQLALYIPIPLYVHVGARYQNIERVNIDIWSKHLQKNTFKKFDWERGEREGLEEKTATMLESKKIESKCDFFALFESPPRCGLNSSGALSAGISTCMNVLHLGLSPQRVQSWQSIEHLEELKNDEHFTQVFEMAWGLDWEIQNGSSGIGPFASLVGGSGEPIIYFLEKGEETEKKEGEYFPWHAYLLSELYNKCVVENFRNLPYVLLYSGKSSATKKAFEKIKEELTEISWGVSLFAEQLGKKEIDIKRIATPLQTILLREAEELENNQTNKSELSRMINRCVVEIERDQAQYSKDVPQYLLDRIWGVLGGFSMIALGSITAQKERLVDMMNVYQSVLSVLGVSTPEIDEICKKFQEKGVIGAKLVGSGTGGDVVVFSPYECNRENIEKKIEKNDYHFHFKSWEKDLFEGKKVRAKNYFIDVHEVGKEPKKTAYVGVLSYELPVLPEYQESGKFPEEVVEKQREIANIVKKTLEILKDNKKLKRDNICLDMLVLPEYTFPCERDDEHSKMKKELMKIAQDNDLIIIAGSYLSKDFEDVCLIFLPNEEEPHKQYRLNRCQYDPQEFRGGHGIKLFVNSRIGDFCAIVCFDFSSEDEIPHEIRKKTRDQSFTLFAVSCCPDKTRYETIADHLALPQGKPSHKGLCAHVIIADSGQGSLYYTAPFRKKKRGNLADPIFSETVGNKTKTTLHVYKLLVEELRKARTPDDKSDYFYSRGAY